jgi:hypothetical protein
LVCVQGKGTKSFRERYRSFWTALVEKLLSLPREGSNKRILGHEILRTVVDQMVALSSMAVVNIRDAVTEAALSVSEAMLQACAALRGELDTVRRQISAEEGNRSKAQAMQNPRYQACLQQRDTITKVHKYPYFITHADVISLKSFVTNVFLSYTGFEHAVGLLQHGVRLDRAAPHPGLPRGGARHGDAPHAGLRAL